MARAVADPSLLTLALGGPLGPQLGLLFHDKELTVLNVTVGPHEWTLPHNHNLRSVIGMYAAGEGEHLLAPVTRSRSRPD